MHTFRVVESWVDEGRLGLRCEAGRYHLARALHDLPPPGLRLNGARPHLGFGVLLCPGSGTVFRVIFELINHVDLSFGADWKPGCAGHCTGDRAGDGTGDGTGNCAGDCAGDCGGDGVGGRAPSCAKGAQEDVQSASMAASCCATKAQAMRDASGPAASPNGRLDSPPLHACPRPSTITSLATVRPPRR